MSNIFEKIISGEIPAYKVAETQDYLAFLDINPLTRGHTLAIPKKNAKDYIFDLEYETYAGLFLFAREVAAAVGQAVECKRVGVSVVGLEVPHAHIHLIPINEVADMSFDRPKLELAPEEFETIAASIRSKL